MDSIKVKCKCGATLQVNPDMAGRLGTCSKCGRTMRIPRELSAKTAAPKKPILLPETEPAAPHEEPAVELLAVEWPALYKKAVTMSVVAVIIFGAALGALVLMPAADDSHTVDSEVFGFRDVATGLGLTFSLDWKIEGSSAGAEIVFVNERLKAEIVLVTGSEMRLNEMREKHEKEAREMSGYKVVKPSATPNSDELGTCFELIWSHKPQGSTVTMVTMARAFSQNNKSFTFRLTASQNEWKAALGEFNDAWNSISFEKGPRISG